MPTPAPSGDVHITYSQQYRRCGKPTCASCREGAGHGPYWYATWREKGRLRRRYLGKALPLDVAEQVAIHAEPTVVAQTSATSIDLPLRVQTLGGFRVWRHGEQIPAERWRRRKAGAVFSALLSASGHILPRERLLEWLWPEADPTTALANLHGALYVLRRVLANGSEPEAWVQLRGDMVALVVPEESGWLDATAFANAAAEALAGRDRAACRLALALYTGEYLVEEPYEEWALQRRELLSHQYLCLLLYLAVLCAEQGELAEAEELLQAVLRQDPCHEDASARLMGLLAADGRRSEALRVYETLAQSLERDLGIGPAVDLEALRAQLVAQAAAQLAPLPPQEVRPVRRTNLPAALTSFVGREQEQQETRTLLESSRLLTLVGAGGCGKTRLALAVADAVVDLYADGVWLVELAVRSDPQLVAGTVATVLGVREEPSRTVLESIRAFLKPRHILLVLDNCEHLLGACRELVTTLLLSCPDLQVLATSREGLGVPGEHLYRVPSLATPTADQVGDPMALARCEAVALFVERARTRRPDFTLTNDTAGAVVQICQQLEGMPLAIELAAARMGVLPVAVIATRLDDRFRLLTGGPRTALPRQQTLRAALDWSYTLLREPERVLLRRLAAFAGGWTLEAAEAVCADPVPARDRDESSIAPYQVLDLLESLVNKSLAMLEEGAHVAQYRMLETVRQYGLEQLERAGEVDLVRGRHVAWYVSLTEQAEPLLRGPEQGAWLARLEAEQPNLRAALQWAQKRGETLSGLRLAASLWRFWMGRGYLSEGRAWLGAFLEQDAAPATLQEAPVLHGKALHAAAALAWSQGDYGHAARCSEDALALFRAVGDKRGVAAALNGLATIARARNEQDQARIWYEESVALQRELGDTAGLAGSLNNLGELAFEQSDFGRAAAYYAESLALHRTLGDQRHVALAQHNLGRALLHQGDDRRAHALLMESLAQFRSLGDTWGIALALHTQGQVSLFQEKYPQARLLAEESLALYRVLDDRRGIADALDILADLMRREHNYSEALALAEESLDIRREAHNPAALAGSFLLLAQIASDQGNVTRADSLFREALSGFRVGGGDALGAIACLEGLAFVACEQGQAKQAAQLYGVVDGLREYWGAPRWPADRPAYESRSRKVRTLLGEAAFARAWAEGHGRPLEQAIAEPQPV